MSHQNRTTLKGYFNTGARPTQEQFADLIDSSLNLVHNGIFDEGGNLGLGHSNPSSRLSVKGSVTVSPDNDSAPGNGLFVHGNVGIGAGFTNPTAQLAVKGGVYIGDTQNTDPGVNSLKVDGNIATEGNLRINGTLRTGDNTTIEGRLRAEGNTTIDSTLHARGNTIIEGTLRAKGNTTIEGTLIAQGDTTIEGRLFADDTVAGGLRVTGDAHIYRQLTVGSITARSLSLTGNIDETEFEGFSKGTEQSKHIIRIPENRVVVGLTVKRYTEVEESRNYYTFALRYR